MVEERCRGVAEVPRREELAQAKVAQAEGTQKARAKARTRASRAKTPKAKAKTAKAKVEARGRTKHWTPRRRKDTQRSSTMPSPRRRT